MLRERMFTGLAAFLMGLSLVFPESTSAHNITLKKAREFAREYARQVRDDSGGKYTHYMTDCRNLFVGHNHYARCIIEYDNEETRNSRTDTRACRETIDVFLQAHNRGETFTYYMKHYSGQCGNKKWYGQRPLN